MSHPIMAKIRYKVLTSDLTSTGLLHSTIVRYKPKRWNYPAEPPQHGKAGPGGLWANRTKSQAKQLQKYLKEKHSLDTVIFVAIIDRILYESSYRTKTNKLFLLEPIC
jgi:hypothetical protein